MALFCAGASGEWRLPVADRSHHRLEEDAAAKTGPMGRGRQTRSGSLVWLCVWVNGYKAHEGHRLPPSDNPPGSFPPNMSNIRTLTDVEKREAAAAAAKARSSGMPPNHAPALPH